MAIQNPKLGFFSSTFSTKEGGIIELEGWKVLGGLPIQNAPQCKNPHIILNKSFFGKFPLMEVLQLQEAECSTAFGSLTIKLLSVGSCLTTGVLENKSTFPCDFPSYYYYYYLWKATIISPLSFLFFRLNISSTVLWKVHNIKTMLCLIYKY